MTLPPKSAAISSLDRINLRLSAETFASIDHSRAHRAGNVSRNTWIAEAIEEKLAREVSLSAENTKGSAANG